MPKDQREKPQMRMKAGKFFFRLSVVILAVFAISLCTKYFRQSKEIAELTQTRDQLQEQAAELQYRNEHIQRRLDEVGSQDYAEQRAREKLGWVKEGEILFVEE